MSEDNDEIVDTIPVYLSKSLAESLYILQYPNKKMNINFDKAQVVNSCVKPLNQEIKIDFALDTAQKHYDAFKGEQFAIAADGGKNECKKDKLTFRDGRMDRQSFISTKPMENVSKYVLGYFKDGQIHASLVKGVIQMRPSFSYFDKSDKRKKAEQKAENEADLEEEEPKQVTVKFARTVNDRQRKAREKTFKYISQKSAEEPWCDTMWYAKDSMEAELERHKLVSDSAEATGHAFSLSTNEYMESLIPAENNQCSLEALLPPRVVSMRKLKAMSLSDQIQYILKDAKVVTYKKLLELLDISRYSHEKIIRALPLVGVLIKGNWVVKSEVLYPPQSVSGINGVPAELMCRARDYILYQFYRDEVVDRRKISNTTQIPADEVKEILQTVAKWEQNKWQLLLQPNPEFDEQHQELKLRQDAYWRGKEENFQELETEDKSPRRKRKISVREAKSDANKQ